ncbi:general stress protein [Pantoea sp. S62]|uniref:general stress protein n=1 Tax=Pantoea sp. S62 TaxID=2769342 RepID=UPI0019112EE2|nr:general stress protein [Pantoea sp. S62]MBK5017135.1 stress-induced protein [Pantoea sp. S62]
MTKLRGGAGNFAANPQRAVDAGRKGGQISGGNFRNDHERAAEAGRKGRKVSRRGKTDSVSS